MIDIRENKPNSTNQVKTEKPNIQKVSSILSGHVAGSMNAAHYKPITYFEVLPGQYIEELKYYGAFKTLTPKSPVFQNADLTFYCVFMPHSAVWRNWEKFIAYKGGTSETKINEIPNMGGKKIPVINADETNNYISLTNTAAWRDSITSTYIPRINGFYSYTDEEEVPGIMPKASILPLRGAIKAWNYIFRDKRYDTEYIEWDGDTVSDTEWLSYMPTTNEQLEKLSFRSKLPDSYYTNYTTQMQGYGENIPDDAIPGEEDPDSSLSLWIQWENLITFARNSVENEMKNDWNIISELFGSAPALEGKPQLIGKTTANLNYSAVTQSAYNTNQNIEEQYQTMGTQGAYSYTNFNGLTLFKNRVFKEAGIVHIFCCCSVDTVYSSAFDRMDLNVNILDKYRPDLSNQKLDVQYQIESGTNYLSATTEAAQNAGAVWGFKRKWSEYFKLRNTIQGDMTPNPCAMYYNNNGTLIDADHDALIEGKKIIDSNKTFAFYENNRWNIEDTNIMQEEIATMKRITKLPWKDYSDYTFNRNLAIPLEIIPYKSAITNENDSEYVINGPNQIFHGGIILMQAILPIENGEAIKNNYTTWKEH